MSWWSCRMKMSWTCFFWTPNIQKLRSCHFHDSNRLQISWKLPFSQLLYDCLSLWTRNAKISNKNCRNSVKLYSKSHPWKLKKERKLQIGNKTGCRKKQVRSAKIDELVVIYGITNTFATALNNGKTDAVVLQHFPSKGSWSDSLIIQQNISTHFCKVKRCRWRPWWKNTSRYL